VLNIAAILDDIYDSFGTPEECELFTQWIERFVLLFSAYFTFKSTKISNHFWPIVELKNNRVPSYLKVGKDYMHFTTLY
jgi:hypothetical protein